MVSADGYQLVAFYDPPSGLLHYSAPNEAQVNDSLFAEIDGEAPTFLLKPKPMTVSAGQKAMFTCRVDGDPAPTVHWMYW